MKYIFSIVFILLFSGCEVFVFGTKRTYEPEPTRETSVGTVYLFKAELDSVNARAAAGLLVRPTGDPILNAMKWKMILLVWAEYYMVCQSHVSKRIHLPQIHIVCFVNLII